MRIKQSVNKLLSQKYSGNAHVIVVDESRQEKKDIVVRTIAQSEVPFRAVKTVKVQFSYMVTWKVVTYASQNVSQLDRGGGAPIRALQFEFEIGPENGNVIQPIPPIAATKLRKARTHHTSRKELPA